MAKTAQYETADEAQEQLIADGWIKDNYDPIYPFINEEIQMRCRVNWCDHRQAYIVEGCYL